MRRLSTGVPVRYGRHQGGLPKTITDTATDYVEGIFQRLREHEYNPELMRLYVLGGGSCLIRNFSVYDASRVTINDDICATAKGYEYLAELNARKGNSR